MSSFEVFEGTSPTELAFVESSDDFRGNSIGEILKPSSVLGDAGSGELFEDVGLILEELSGVVSSVVKVE